jgi:hypothetical protein
VVEHLIQNPKIEGLNPAGTRKEKNSTKAHLATRGSTVVGCLTHNPKIEGLNPTRAVQ